MKGTGKVIKEIRQERKIQQNELAQACEISQAYLSQIEQDKVNASTDVYTKIGILLGVPFGIINLLRIEEVDVYKLRIHAWSHVFAAQILYRNVFDLTN